MKKVLFLPFLKMPSGHHQTAKALASWIKTYDKDIICESVDIFSFAFQKTEAFISRSYLYAIQYFPSFYSWLYRKNACENHDKGRFLFYELLFEREMLKLIQEKQPDWLICTHALPSYILNRLKLKQKIDLPIVNVYTDYFINSVWGTEAIDFHLVPDTSFKEELIQSGVNERSIFVTGIPLHPSIQRSESFNHTFSKYNLLVAGGSLGVGGIQSFIRKLTPFENIHFYVLCGKNKRLYETLKNMNKSHVTPLPYIQNPREMNVIYEQMNGIITKPGGVTVTESLYKHIPIFIYHTLPGQEEMNFSYLSANGLAYDLRSPKEECIGQAVLTYLSDDKEMGNYKQKLSLFQKRIADKNLAMFLSHIV